LRGDSRIIESGYRHFDVKINYDIHNDRTDRKMNNYFALVPFCGIPFDHQDIKMDAKCLYVPPEYRSVIILISNSTTFSVYSNTQR